MGETGMNTKQSERRPNLRVVVDNAAKVNRTRKRVRPKVYVEMREIDPQALAAVIGEAMRNA